MWPIAPPGGFGALLGGDFTQIMPKGCEAVVRAGVASFDTVLCTMHQMQAQTARYLNSMHLILGAWLFLPRPPPSSYPPDPMRQLVPSLWRASSWCQLERALTAVSCAQGGFLSQLCSHRRRCDRRARCLPVSHALLLEHLVLTLSPPRAHRSLCPYLPVFGRFCGGRSNSDGGCWWG